MKLMIIDKNEIEVPLLEAENSGRGAFFVGVKVLFGIITRWGSASPELSFYFANRSHIFWF
jgi:hypothetical protein